MTVDPLMFGIDWMDFEWWLEIFGPALFWVCLGIVFVECGLLFPFLPGDTLLFSVGLFLATGKIEIFDADPLAQLVVACLLLTASAFAGNVVGYEIGRKIGTPLYQRDGRFIKRKHFDQTRDFFDRHGSSALVIGRFVAFVRTFITVVAGATQMNRRRFWLWSFIGAVAWVVSVTALGYFLGKRFPALGDNIDLALLLIMAIFAVPLIVEWRKSRKA
ncbi:membrane-associated protein [Nocardioides daedukensis]|uniref:Membrane-associated protein n=1 Tax=Nocardioides daedukensis TaxID=634462 RepID=A0A7Y9S479_9ACTN|nr:membrane-associated protein [Nocardioides daedukensis]